MSKLSNEEIKDIVDNEGLDYAIMHYLSPGSIDDLKLKDLWIKAKTALQAVDDYLDNA